MRQTPPQRRIRLDCNSLRSIHGTIQRQRFTEMPYAPKRPCRHPACREYATERGYCAAHQSMAREAGRIYDETTRKDDPRKAASKKLRSSSAWTKLSKQFKAHFPTCCDPLKRHGEYPPLSHHVHHVIPLEEDITQGLVWDNLRSICSDCHRQVESMVRRGEPTAHLFDASKPPEITICFA